MTSETRPVLDDDTAEMIAIHVWARGSRDKIALWGALHNENRVERIVAVLATARQLVALGWTPPPATEDGEDR